MFDFNKIDTKRTACVCAGGSSYTYEDLAKCIDSMKPHLQSRFLLFCFSCNDWETIVGYSTCLNGGVPMLLLDGDIEANVFDNLRSLYQPRYVWGRKEKVGDLGDVLFEFGSYLLVELQNGHEMPLPQELAMLLTTSGSTGSPKLVRLSYDNLKANAESIISYLQITNEERAVTSLPPYYSFGMSVINSHLMAGATLLLTNESYVQKSFWNFVRDNDCTSFAGVPYTFQILKMLKFWSIDLPSLKTITQAGGKLDNNVLKFFIEKSQEHNVRFFLMYGQTEAAPRMSFLEPDKGIEKLGSIGKGIPGGTFKLIDDEGSVITTPNTEGELVYYGRNVCLGYAETAADLYKGDENNGVLYTGDIAKFDEDGFYFIVGRKKRFVKLFGNRVSLDYIESLLKPHLKECACVGNDSFLVVYTTTKNFVESEIIDIIVQRTKILRTSFKVRYIEEIPRSQTGKILYGELPV